MAVSLKNGSKMINAVANSTVPHVTVIVGSSYGAGNYGMSGRAFGTSFTYIWPFAKIAVMGPQANGWRNDHLSGAELPNAAVQNSMKQPMKSEWPLQSIGLKSAQKVYTLPQGLPDDGMIDPRDTREVIAMSLSACHNNEVKGTKEYGTWRM